MRAATRKRRRNQEEGDILEMPVGVPVPCETVTVDDQGRLIGITVQDEEMTVGSAENPRGRRTVRIKRRRR
jgi:hypothetical protein